MSDFTDWKTERKDSVDFVIDKINETIKEIKKNSPAKPDHICGLPDSQCDSDCEAYYRSVGEINALSQVSNDINAADANRKRIAELEAENAKIKRERDEYLELLDAAFFQFGCTEGDRVYLDGWIDDNASPTLRDIADALVKAGRLEQHPKNKRLYRRIKPGAGGTEKE